jgi:hypothetical protein
VAKAGKANNNVEHKVNLPKKPSPTVIQGERYYILEDVMNDGHYGIDVLCHVVIDHTHARHASRKVRMCEEVEEAR